MKSVLPEAKELYESGKSCYFIATYLNVSRTWLGELIKRYKWEKNNNQIIHLGLSTPLDFVINSLKNIKELDSKEVPHRAPRMKKESNYHTL